MYYIIYPIFYILSLLPLRVLYFISNALYVLAYYIIGYRKKVVFNNLNIAFPNKTEQEKTKIAKKCYKNLIDTFIETIKLISISKKDFFKRVEFDNSIFTTLHQQGFNVQIHGGHFFNYEFMNLAISGGTPYTLLGVYAPISNKAIDKIIFNMRKTFGTQLIAKTKFRSQFHNLSKQQYALGLIADQSPQHPHNAYWAELFGVKTPFVKGPEDGAKKMNTAVVMLSLKQTKRGYYKIIPQLLTTQPNTLPKGYITKALVKFVEDNINDQPHNYLWTHKRFKHTYQEKYKDLLV